MIDFRCSRGNYCTRSRYTVRYYISEIEANLMDAQLFVYFSALLKKSIEIEISNQKYCNKSALLRKCGDNVFKIRNANAYQQRFGAKRAEIQCTRISIVNQVRRSFIC